MPEEGVKKKSKRARSVNHLNICTKILLFAEGNNSAWFPSHRKPPDNLNCAA